MTITERLEQKRAEYAQVNAEQEQLWAIVKVKQDELRAAQDPWHKAYGAANKLQSEIATLESLAKEME